MQFSRILCALALTLTVGAAASAQPADDPVAASEQRDRARENFRQAIAEGEAALRALAGQVRDDSDRNTLAAYHHFFAREVRQAADALLDSASCGEGARR